MNKWIWIVLWASVMGIILSDIIAMIVIKPGYLTTWLAALACAWVPFSVVYIAQLVMTGHKVPFKSK